MISRLSIYIGSGAKLPSMKQQQGMAPYCHTIAYNILDNNADAEESVNYWYETHDEYRVQIETMFWGD